MTFVNWLIIVAGVFLIGYIAVRVYTRWCSMADELRYRREEVRELKSDIEQRIRLIEQKSRSHHDSIYKSLADLQENIERLKRWQISINDIFINREPQEQKEQQTPYHPTPRNAMRRRKR